MAGKKAKHKLQAEKRKISGRRVKKLREEGILPTNVYGKKIKSQSLQMGLKEFLPVYEESGETGVVDLQIKGETKVRPVLIHNVQLDPVTDQPLHADFYQVSLKEKVTTEIPIELVGESVAVKDKIGVLIQPLSEVEVEALPTELPDKFEIDLGRLEKIDDAFTVGDLKAPKGVKILTGEKEVLAKIEAPSKEEEKPVEVAAPAEGEEVPEGQEAEKEGEAPVKEGEEKPAGKEEEKLKEGEKEAKSS